MDMTPYQEPLPTEIEQIRDEARADCGLPPAKRKPGRGLADMRARIEYHTALLAKFRKQPPSVARLAGIRESKRQLAEAHERLAEYQLQADGLN